MSVTSQQLETSLEKVRARVRDARDGLYGPSSLIWRVNREQLLFTIGARAALLQEAHPFVAHGVDQHSKTKTDPIGRFVRTFKNVHGMVFGDLESALTAARRVHKYHTTIRGQISENTGTYSKGTDYEANNEKALLWVHATIWESSVVAYEAIFHPLSAQEKERYYQETKLFAYMFGIPDELLPPSWPEFMEYNRRMWNSSELAVGDTARDMADFLLSPNNHFHSKYAPLIGALTTGFMPSRFREEYRLKYGLRERATFEAALVGFRGAWRLMPRHRRFVPPYLRALERLGRGIQPSLPERMFERFYEPRLANPT